MAARVSALDSLTRNLVHHQGFAVVIATEIVYVISAEFHDYVWKAFDQYLSHLASMRKCKELE